MLVPFYIFVFFISVVLEILKDLLTFMALFVRITSPSFWAGTRQFVIYYHASRVHSASPWAVILVAGIDALVISANCVVFAFFVHSTLFNCFVLVRFVH